MQNTSVSKNEKMQYAVKFVLSAIAPDTMVVAVVANDSWNRKQANVRPMSCSSASTRKKPRPLKSALPPPELNCKAVAEAPVTEAAHDHVGHVLHEDVDLVLARDAAGLEQAKACAK
ncbi:hypothetical protein MTO96_008328 [Rhipicephalus appendiculatus]